MEQKRDILERLRGLATSLRGLDWCDSIAPDEAAVEIKRLREALWLTREDLAHQVAEIDKDLAKEQG